MAGAGPWLMTNEGRARLADGTFGNLLAANAVKVGLASSSSNLGASSTTYALLTGELPTANGYTVGGVAATLTNTGTAPNVALSLTTSITVTASGGNIVFHWWFVYEPGGHLLAYCLGDSTPADVTITNTFTETLSNSAPVLNLA